MAASRKAYLDALAAKEGWPYVYGARGSYVDAKGVVTRAADCSGIVLLCYHEAGGPDWRMKYGTHELFDLLPDVAKENVKPGDLCFYGAKLPVGLACGHVMTLMEDGRVFGATGGGRSTTTPELAQAHDAKAKYKFGPHYRPDFVGFKRLEFAEP